MSPAPEPIITAMPRRVSEVSAGSSAVLRHPSPGGSGTYSRNNISRLERSAEEISQGGSDIVEEIRKMNEMSRSTSRSTSIQSSHQGDLQWRTSRTNSGNNHSILDVNGTARWGGYSPAGFITSPTGSVRSHSSWTQASGNRVPSSTKSSRLAHTTVEPLREGRPLDSPLAPSNSSIYSQEQYMSRQASQSSFSRRYDALSSQIEESLQTIPPALSPHREHDEQDLHYLNDVPDRPHSTDTFQEAQIAFKDFDGVHFDPDREEYVEVDEEGHEVRRVSARSSSGTFKDAASMLRMAHGERPISYGVPPPSENMVYYPAPVPRMLNLPKRLSQQPPPHVQAKRRTQMLGDLPAGARQSAPWIPPMTFSEDGRPSQDGARSHDEGVRSQRSGSGSANYQEQPRGMLNERMSMANIPPQLRASMFFEHQPVHHDVEVKSASAVATLDSILAASVSAPVNAFTDHPYVGDVRKTVYAQERSHQRQSTSTTLGTEKEKKVKKRRSSSIGNLFRRKSTDLEGEVDEGKKSRPVSHGSMLDFNGAGNKLQKRRSQLSLGGELDRIDDDAETPGDERERRRQTGLGLGLVDGAVNSGPREERIPSGSRPVTAIGKPLTDAEQIEADFREQEALEDLEDVDDDPIYAQPTTLLAELQVRKAQLRSRNKTAATAFPDGMHSTLLQLDAVEQIKARKRQKQRIALAWEDPDLRAREEAEKDEIDEDVPLGVLFPGKDGLVNRKLGDSRDWGRPLGLMARRELEDNEPLSSRRNRLNPNAGPTRKEAMLSQLHLAGQPDMTPEKDENEDEEETLGQRLRRLKTKDALDTAISGATAKERPDSTFATSVLDEFPEFKESANADAAEGAPADLKTSEQAAPGAEEETLGQRRARLQRERQASGETPTGGAVRPPLKTSNSLANLLSSNPVGQRAGMAKTQQAAQGTLLHTANQHHMKHRQDLLASNMRSSSYNLLDKPLVDASPQANRDPKTGLLAAERSRPANGAYTGNVAGLANPLSNTKGEVTGGLLAAERSRPANGAYAGGAYSTTLAGGTPLAQSSSTPMFNMGGNNPYFASPTAAIAYGGNNNNMMAYQMQQQQQYQQQPMVNPSAYYALSGGHASMMMPTQSVYHPMAGMNAMGAGTYAYSAQQQMADYANLDPNQRAAIDRWRMGVAQ